MLGGISRLSMMDGRVRWQTLSAETDFRIANRRLRLAAMHRLGRTRGGSMWKTDCDGCPKFVYIFRTHLGSLVCSVRVPVRRNPRRFAESRSVKPSCGR
jgi:hypothetical protein